MKELDFPSKQDLCDEIERLVIQRDGALAAARAERARAQKLVEALRLIAGPSEFNCEIGESNQRAAAQKALAEYESKEKGE